MVETSEATTIVQVLENVLSLSDIKHDEGLAIHGFLQVGAALNLLHNVMGIPHLGINSDNIVVAPDHVLDDPVFKLTGIFPEYVFAKAGRNQQLLRFFPPEVLRKQTLSIEDQMRGDSWSLAMLLFETDTQAQLFTAKSIRQLQREHELMSLKLIEHDTFDT